MKIAFKFLTLIFLISAISSVKCDTLSNNFILNNMNNFRK